MAPTLSKPRFRGVSHELAFFAAAGAGAVLVELAPPAARLAAAVYAGSLATMLGVSALYHRGSWAPGPYRRMGRLDHSAIFLLVAGAYTPLAMRLRDGGRAAPAIACLEPALGTTQSLLWP